MLYIVETIGIKYIVIYLIVINLIGFLAMGIDKYKAKRNYWRIPEGTLMMLAVLGGGIGTISGIYVFRHKTKKMKFVIGFPTILIIEIILMLYLIIRGTFWV